ncbi:DNA-binding response regulator [Marinomonas sp. 42_23_T18]|nr:DNA-binding response regulator [Marinomonas sp. 42_23_T18]
MRILLVEDDDLLGNGIKKSLTREGYQVDWLMDGKQGLAALKTESFDLVLLDLNLPGMGGLDLLTTIRKQQNQTPVLILTASDTLDEKIAGLDTGADDYLVKPFEMAELKARMRALSRRQHGHAEPNIEYGRLQVNPASMQVQLDGEEVVLGRREFTLLMEFVNHPGQILSRAKLEDVVYGWDGDVESNSIEVHIHHLRKKLYPEFIKTVRGMGYKAEKPK